MSQQKKYWNSVQHLEEDQNFLNTAEKEFAEYIPVEEFLGKTNLDQTSTSRRDFLKFLGFSISAATLAACETPVTRSVPYVNKPEEINPGIANYYASNYYDGHDFGSILVKTREGRPIHIEGNKLSSLTKGGVNARINSSVLSLYDSKRLKGALKDGKEISWETLDKEIADKLKNTVATGKKVVLLSQTLISPSSKMLVEEFKQKLNASSNIEGASMVQHVTYDALSASGIIRAHEALFNTAALPSYSFDQAKVICSIGADFLSNWIDNVEHAMQYVTRRKPEGEWMSKHYQFESGLSLTGSNADVRVAVKPSEQGKVAVAIYNELASKAGAAPMQSLAISEDQQKAQVNIKKVAQDLWNHKGASLVVAGSNDRNIQMVVAAINQLLGNYEKTVHLSAPSYTKSANDDALKGLVSDMKSGQVGAILLWGVDPVYSLPKSLDFVGALDKVALKLSLADKITHTSQLCNYIAPDHHYLESWNDVNPKEGHYALCQPVISPLFKTRQAQDSLMIWAGITGTYHEYLQKVWETHGYPSEKGNHPTFLSFWSKSLHDGVTNTMPVSTKTLNYSSTVLNEAVNQLSKIKSDGWELELYSKTAIADGSQADNPWLQELPDPVTKVVWDNYITMNPSDMKEMGLNTKLGQQEPASMAKVSANGYTLELPVYPVPGQKRKSIGIALGYGKAKVGDDTIGKNAFPFLTITESGDFSYQALNVGVEKIAGEYAIASTQTHHTMMDKDPENANRGRKIVLETDLATFKKGKEAYNPQLVLNDAYGDQKIPTKINQWGDHPIETFGHHWGMSIDLSTCIGCSACVTACSSENNVPVVGKDEIRRNRDMFWLRIDRYFSTDMTEEKAEEQGIGKIDMYRKMEDPSEYPQVVFQPVMCQHCNHAPCETVCPVAATTHSNEGMNQMAYNRCIGTRYCGNNCPYKVRRFNWFQYDSYSKFTGINPAQDDISRMVLNPDVVVRSRGVMEKCTFCVQRVQAGKLEAKKKGEALVDGSIVTACASACPTNAISFGDLNDSNSQVRKNFDNDRAYFLLEEVGVQPNVKYLVKVRNTESKEA